MNNLDGNLKGLLTAQQEEDETLHIAGKPLDFLKQSQLMGHLIV